MGNGDREAYVEGGMDDAERPAGPPPGLAPGHGAGHTAGHTAGHGAGRAAGHPAGQAAGHTTGHGAGRAAGHPAGHGAGRAAGRGRVWRRGIEYGGLLVLSLGGTAVLYGAAVGDRDIVEMMAFLVPAAVLFQLLAGWLAGPARDPERTAAVSRATALLVALPVALVAAWPNGDWIPDNDPTAGDAFISPSTNLAQVWIVFLPGYAVAVLALLTALRLSHRLRTSSRPAPKQEPAAPGGASLVGEAADLLVMGLPIAVILLVDGMLPMPGDAPEAVAVLIAGVWCAVSTLAGAVRLALRFR